jgi:plastocyanin domain-containing protein
MYKKIFVIATCFVLTYAISALAATRGEKKQESSRTAQNEKAAQSQTVEITEKGFQPEVLKLKVNVPARLTFVRRTDKTCVREVLIKEYDVKRELPLNEPITVEFTPRKSGEFAFACGMGMLRGKLVVE